MTQNILEAPLTDSQQQALDAINAFCADETHDTFILRGYAGTGKTFLMQRLAAQLAAAEKRVKLLATTGRAAAVLRGKTGQKTATIHGELYVFQDIDGLPEQEADFAAPDQYGQLELLFACRPADDPKSRTLYIVDEASMLADVRTADSSFAQFGTGNLLQDLLHAVGSNKIIFVGDPCQLPPVGQPFSPALDENYLRAVYQRRVLTAALLVIMRTRPDNDILDLATALRHMANRAEQKYYPKLPARNRRHVTVHPTPHALVADYLNAVQRLGMERVIGIARSNASCLLLNRHVRQWLWGDPIAPLRVGDILMVTQNNYLVPLTNGDFVRVLEVGMERREAAIAFVDVRVQHLFSQQEHAILLAKDPLAAFQANLTPEQNRNLLIAYTQRMARKGHKPKSLAYRDGLRTDPFLNSLRATYGYAVTGHKAQGGEWDEVYLFLKKFGAKTDADRRGMIRWWYTAVTRTRERLHLHQDWWVADP